MKNISTHIVDKKAIYSDTAIRLNIKNEPSDYEISNMVNLANNIFEPLREFVGGAIKITSMFRCNELNVAIGGAKRSQHREGRAMDIDDVFGHKTNAEMFNFIRENLNFDQLVWEFGTDENPNWVHVSYVSDEENRNRCLKAERVNGKTVYSII